MALRLNGSTSGYVELDAPAVAGTTALTLPASSGTVATQAYADTAGGLVHITTQSFSAVSSVSVNNCFTSTYTNYQIIIDSLTASTSAALRLRLRLAGTDSTTGNYDTRGTFVNSSATGAYRSNGETAFDVFALNSGFAFGSTMQVMGPQLAQNTNFAVSGIGRNGTPSSESVVGSLAHYVSTGYDGFTIYPSTGNITGTVRVYGYLND
jgi:hypothetical protein